jgi:hypothetical protein
MKKTQHYRLAVFIAFGTAFTFYVCVGSVGYLMFGDTVDAVV